MRHVILSLMLVLFVITPVLAHGDEHEEEPDSLDDLITQRDYNGTLQTVVFFALVLILPILLTWLVYLHRTRAIKR